MTIDEFEACSSRWGANLANWPNDRRDEADELLASSEDVRSLQYALEAMEVDLAFAAQVSDPPTVQLMERILADASVALPQTPVDVPITKSPSRRGIFNVLSPFWQTAATCTASAMMGILVGYMSPADVAEAATSIAFFEQDANSVAAAEEDVLSFDIAYADLEPF